MKGILEAPIPSSELPEAHRVECEFGSLDHVELLGNVGSYRARQ